MIARWILPVALVICGADATLQAQYNQPATASARIVAQQQPTSQFSAQQNPQYSAQATSQFQNAASNQPTLPPTNASAFGQQGAQYAQPNNQAYPLGSSFTQQPAQQPRSSVFSTQPTVNATSQGWTGAAQPASNQSDPRYATDPRYTNDPRYTASVTNDPRYAAPQLSPPENSSLQPYGTQFNNTLRDAQQQAQQYGQQAQQLGQTARDWQQQAQQVGQQVQPYLSSLTNNPYAYVPPPPQADPAANQYLSASSQTGQDQFGRSVLVNNQQSTGSSFGQYNQEQYNTSQPYNTSGSQFTSAQQPQNNSTFDNRGQLYQPELIANPRLTSGQSAFTTSGQSSATPNNQDPRLMQPPTQDPRYASSNDPRTQQDPRYAQDPRNLTLEPPLSSTLPAGSGQVATTGASGQLSSPYEYLQTPRADGQTVQPNNFNNSTTTPQNNATTTFANGTKTEVPSLFNNVLPTNNSRLGNATSFGGQFGTPPSTSAASTADDEVQIPYTPLIVSLVCLFASIGANFYFGWNFTEYYFRYRKLLVEGEDDDRSRTRDEDRDSRRR